MTEVHLKCPYCGYDVTADTSQEEHFPTCSHCDFALAWKIKFGCSKCGRLVVANLKDFDLKEKKAATIRRVASH